MFLQWFLLKVPFGDIKLFISHYIYNTSTVLKPASSLPWRILAEVQPTPGITDELLLKNVIAG